MGKCTVMGLGGGSSELGVLRYYCTGSTARTYTGAVAIQVHDGMAEVVLPLFPLGSGKISSIKITIDGSTTAQASAMFAYFSASETGCGGSVSSVGGVITATPPQSSFNVGLLALNLWNI